MEDSLSVQWEMVLSKEIGFTTPVLDPSKAELNSEDANKPKASKANPTSLKSHQNRKRISIPVPFPKP
ncbi:hypothetical protein L2E82_15361 [Cichorium intybus]|uniref:Uncharacterized protein n=1 Tax=Cichorium intybus TaxID=13427 RepID=A0ACB9F317_CICIN|nr:hypothetical protein L2E82_15361 [Cichorium intybus]